MTEVAIGIVIIVVIIVVVIIVDVVLKWHSPCRDKICAQILAQIEGFLDSYRIPSSKNQQKIIVTYERFGNVIIFENTNALPSGPME